MSQKLEVFLIVLMVACATHLPSTAANGNSSSTNRTETIATLSFVWIERAPYVMRPTNDSFFDYPRGIIRDSLQNFLPYCGEYVTFVKANSEFEMIELLRQKKAHAAAPIFEPANNRRYSEFLFFKLDDYPGTIYISTAYEEKDVVLQAVIRSWPLIAFTLILTAIAGIIIWSLDTYWNTEEFPRPFIKGSWDGFWWSFISMTTVGYGDKVPRSIFARIFSIIWILFGVTAMAIFTGNVTSALTAYSLEHGPNSLDGLNVAVLNNSTEYHHALELDALPKVYDGIDEATEALKSNEVDGMLLDRYTASHYQGMNKLESLFTVKKFEFQRDVGILFSKEKKTITMCLEFYRPEIYNVLGTVTDSLKLTQQKPTSNAFYGYSSQMGKLLYISLGVLGGLLLIGLLWEKLYREKIMSKVKDTRAQADFKEREFKETKHIFEELEEGRRFLQRAQEQFDKLQARFQSSGYNSIERFSLECRK